ncbi:MAG TPA: hypothetical protein VMG33_13290 [Steroidobacteraceae bacterium]|nr:hypothetical protein [Steroidobacteraceae bacterium]
MMSPRFRFLAVAVLVCLAPAARAQYYSYGLPDNNPVRWHIMGGYSQPVGDADSLLQGGWHFGFGVTWHQPESPFALRLDIDYATNNATNHLLDEASSAKLQFTGGWADFWTGTLNGEFRIPLTPVATAYLIAGGGAYYTRMSFTELGYGYVCNPWWYYCYPGVGEYVVDSKDVTKFGWNAGAGVFWRLRGGTQLFVEGRYNEVKLNQTISWVPVTIGLRF